MSNLEKFAELGLSEKSLLAISKKGFEEPSPIQKLTIPLLLKNEKDIVGQAQTGTGKTAAFGLPIMDKITEGIGKVQALVLAPTRELAVQVAEEIFDRPVYLDYEVPYFKIRVGSFFDRDQAEDYMMRARAAGYKEAWVVVTNVAVREAAPLYFDEPYPVFDDSLEKQIHPDTLFETEDEPVTDG